MKLHHIALIGSDRNRTVRFYEALGFTATDEIVRQDKGDIMLFLRDGDVTLEIFIKKNCPARPSYPEAYGLRHLALYTENVRETAEHLKQLGYCPEPIRTDTVTGRAMTFVPDPDGLPVELHE